MPKKKYNFPLGELNPISYAGSTRHRNISRNDIIDNPLAAHQRVLKGAYAPQLFNGAKVFKAIVLKKIDVNVADTILGNVLNKISEVFNISERKSVYICRIPEVHAHLPDPFGITVDSDKRNRIIDMYPTFFPISQTDNKISLSVSTINPGSIVEIEFSDASMSNGILKKIVKLSTHVEIPEDQIENFQFKHGELNPTQFSISRGAKYSSKNIIDNPAVVHDDMTSRRAAQTMFKKGKVFRAIVMKVENIPSNSDPLSNLLNSIFPTVQRQNVHICRVPELHAHLPDPILMKDEDKKRVLQYYPRFVFNPVGSGRTSYENEVKEGSIVEVEFEDQTYSTGMIKKVVKANANYEPTNPSASGMFSAGDLVTTPSSKLESEAEKLEVDPVKLQEKLNSLVPGAVLTSAFGYRGPVYNKQGDIVSKEKDHVGIDIAAPEGTPVSVPMEGKVISLRSSNKGYGNQVVIEHPDGSRTTYSHLKDDSFNVAVGAVVKPGDEIAQIGSTGASTGPHLHYEYIDKDGKTRMDPMHSFTDI